MSDQGPSQTTTAPPPSTAGTNANISAKGGGPRSRHQVNLKKYGTPLPILLPQAPRKPYTPHANPQSQSQSQTQTQISSSSTSPASSLPTHGHGNGNESGAGARIHSSLSSLSNFLATFASSTSSTSDKSKVIEVPRCTGIYDHATRSVWITDRQDAELLFRRGFFGKGTLSRSEPSWRERRVGLLKGGDVLLAEQVREKRRLERKKFKVERAAAMLDAAMTAEAVLVTGQAPEVPSVEILTAGDEGEGEGGGGDEGRDGGEDQEDHDRETLVMPSSPAPSTSASTIAVDVSTLNAQTFLVRPTRPDANRNRGKKAFKRKPPPTQAQKDARAQAQAQAQALESAPIVPSPSRPQAAIISEVDDEAAKEAADIEAEEDSLLEELVEEMEHLQLSLEEAWFLSTALGVLRIIDPITKNLLQPNHVLPLLLTPTTTSLSLPTNPTTLLPDDPFLVSYVAYHHFRTIGWVVKPGIKFCADWLLYRRGPVFSHSAFAVVLVPVYDDPAEKLTSPYGNTDWYEERNSWKWMNTIMRVNSLVQKTVILAYVTIPALSSFPASKRDGAGLDPSKNDMASLLKSYTIREVALTRFGPARRRD